LNDHTNIPPNPPNVAANASGHLEKDSSNPAPFVADNPSTLRTIFIGSDGIRAGWSLLIFIALMAAVLAGLRVIGHLMHFPKQNSAPTEIAPGFAVFSELLPFLGVLLVTWIMSKIEKRPNSGYGLGGERPVHRFLAGLAWGVTCLSLLVLTLWMTGLLVFDKRLLFGAQTFHYGVIWLMGFLFVGLLEEYLTRGYLLSTLTRGLGGIYWWLFKTRNSKALGFWTAALGLSILFGLGHGSNPGESPIGLLSAGLAGLVFCLSLWRTGSLWWAIGFHTTWDWAQSFLYGVADSGLMVQNHLFATHPLGRPLMSGGTTGPEGSIFILPTLALISVIIIFTLPRTGYADAQTMRESAPIR